jgi:hypothetical protein
LKFDVLGANLTDSLGTIPLWFNGGEEKKPRAKRKAIHASPNGLPIKEYKCFVYWLEGFRNEPGPLGLTADAALSSIGAFTMLLSSPMNMDSAAGLKAAGSRPLKGLSRAGENSRV